MGNIYTSGGYLETTNTWHAEDSPWKARQIISMIRRNGLSPASIAEIGCGAGGILNELSVAPELNKAAFTGYDISPQAIQLCQDTASPSMRFVCGDLLADPNAGQFDVLLIIDVIEHVPDYMGFATGCRDKAYYKIYHIPLEVHVSSVLRKSLLQPRYTIGHLHYFTAESALATLKDTGHEILDVAYTNGAVELFTHHKSVRRALANIPRRVVGSISERWAAQVLGGFSLLVLTK